MKKYIKPTLRIVRLDSQALLAASGPAGSNVNDSGTPDGIWGLGKQYDQEVWEFIV